MGNVPLTSGGQLPICPAQPGCSALPISLRVKAKSVWKNPCAWLFLACSVSNHMKVSIFYFEKEEKTPSLQVFCVCVLFFFSSTGSNGVKNRCCVNLKMRHQGLWLTKRITFLCILWILKGYIKISWYVLRTDYVCSWELLRLDDYRNYVSLEKLKVKGLNSHKLLQMCESDRNSWGPHSARVRAALTPLFPEVH